jgi:hypothetical protein
MKRRRQLIAVAAAERPSTQGGITGQPLAASAALPDAGWEQLFFVFAPAA